MELTAAESGGEGVVEEKGRGEGSGYDVEGIGRRTSRWRGVGGDISPKVAKTDTEIGICVEVR